MILDSASAAVKRIQEIQIEFSATTQYWSDRKLITVMGFLSNLVYCVMSKNDAICRDASQIADRSKDNFQIDQGKLFSLVNRAGEGGLSVSTPVTYTKKYLDEHWQVDLPEKCFQRGFSVHAIRNIREELAVDLHLFSYEVRREGDSWRPAQYREINLMRIIALYEHLEKLWLSRDRTLEQLPKHRGCMMMQVFNLIMGYACSYNRIDSDGGTATIARLDKLVLRSLSLVPVGKIFKKIITVVAGSMRDLWEEKLALVPY